jgi:hypothetical protein
LQAASQLGRCEARAGDDRGDDQGVVLLEDHQSCEPEDDCYRDQATSDLADRAATTSTHAEMIALRTGPVCDGTTSLTPIHGVLAAQISLRN